AASALLAMPLQMAVATYFVGRQIGLRPKELAQALWKSGIVTLCSAAAAAAGLAFSNFGHGAAPAELLASGSPAIAACASALALTRHPLLEHVRFLASAFRPHLRALRSN